MNYWAIYKLEMRGKAHRVRSPSGAGKTQDLLDQSSVYKHN